MWSISGAAATSIKSTRTRRRLVQSLDKQVAGVAHEAVQDWPYDLVDGCGGDKVSCNTRQNISDATLFYLRQRPTCCREKQDEFSANDCVSLHARLLSYQLFAHPDSLGRVKLGLLQRLVPEGTRTVLSVLGQKSSACAVDSEEERENADSSALSH